MSSFAARAPRAFVPESWRSLSYFNGYRFAVAFVLLATAFVFGDGLTFGSRNHLLFIYLSTGYVAASFASFFLIEFRWPSFSRQLALLLCGDIAFIVLLMYASGGIASGLGLLLLPSLAATGSVSRGKMSVFYAALASVAVLTESAYEVIALSAPFGQYVQAGLMSIGYFATAWVAHTLAKYTVGAEELAAKREIDLANLGQVSQLVIEDMRDGVIVVDEKGVVRQRNLAAEKLFGEGASKEQLLRDYSPVLAERLREWRLNSAMSFEPVMSPITHNPIQTRFVRVGRQHYFGAVVFLEDLRRVQAQAQQLKLAALGRLTASIAHEIRNPLSAISHATELLQEESDYSQTQSRLMRIIGDNTQRLNRMVQEVLKLGRWDHGQPETIDPAAFLVKFIKEFSNIEKTPPDTFAIEINTERGIVFDRTHFNQVLWNLARNALRHCQKLPGSIKFTVDGGGADNTVRLAIQDDGPGVPPALRGQLFEPFFTTVSSGTGLGLCIAREVCEGNGARLDFVPGEGGAQFSVTCKGVSGEA
jgi:two-component system sensor histidine kinase PilS (NtrC family)